MAEGYLDVKQVTFYPDGQVTFDYSLLPHDLRDNGVAMTHGVMASPDPEIVDELEELHDHAQRTLAAVLERFEQGSPEMPPGVLIEDEDDDDEPAPFDNPLER